MKKIISSLILSFVSVISFGQITITQTQSPQQLVDDVLTGSGVVISNVTYNYSNPDAQNVQTTIGYFNSNGTGFPISEGIILATGDAILAVGPNNNNGATNNNGVAAPDPADPDLAAIGSAVMNNECILEFDFIPSGDTIVFNYIFASEEYLEYVNAGFNDGFGFFISGPGIAGPYSLGAENIAIIPGSTTPVTIDNVNTGTNPGLYVDNPGGVNIQYDGRTIVMQASASVICGETYHIKLAIADAGDQVLDSGVFLEANSFASNGVDVQIASATGSAAITEACDSAIVTFIRPEDSDTIALTINYGVGGTATNGVDYNNLTGSVTFPIGVDTVQFFITPVADGLAEGTETVELSVDIVNSCGDTITTTAVVEIIDPLPFNIITTDTTITCPADSIMIQVTTDGGIPVLDYSWTVGGTTNELWVPALVNGTVPYIVDVTDACGVTSQGTVNVTVMAAPIPTIAFDNDQLTICPGQDATFEVINILNSYSPGNETYDWSPEPSSTSTITVMPSVVTWYYVDVFDGCYTVTDSVKVLMGGVSLGAINITDAEGCPSQGIFNPGSIEVLPTGLTYTLVGGGNTVGPQAGNNFGGLTGNITYALNVVNADGCEVDTLVTVGSLTAIVDADWIVVSVNDVTCAGDQDGTAEIQNINGGLNSGPYDVIWTNQTGQSSSLVGVFTGAGDVVDTLNGGNWVVTVVEQGSGCAWSQVFTIFEPAPLLIDLSNYSSPSCFELNDGDLTAIISGGNAITAGVGTVTITNSNGDLLNTGVSDLTINNLVTDTYTVSIVDDNGCITSESILINEPGEISIDFTLTNPTCYGIESGIIWIDTVYNYQNTNGYDSLYYEWVPNPSGNNGIGYFFTNHLGEGLYQLKITDGSDCYKFFDFEIEYPDSIYFDELGFDATICRNQIPFDNGHGQVFAAAAGGADGNGNGTNFQYVWTEDGVVGSSTTNSTWGNRNPGYYTIVATNDLGCTITETIYVDSLSPVADFTITFAQGVPQCVGPAIEIVDFTNNSINYAFSEDVNADTTFVWSFSIDGDTTTYVGHEISEIVQHPYASEGLYSVCLTVVENLNGCIDSSCQFIQVYDCPVLIVPNVFTPGEDGNGDNINDYFYFPNVAIIEFECTVFDRWGVEVFKFLDIETGWNGNNQKNEKPCSDGVYFYVYTAESSNGTEFSGQGNIHLIRK